VAGHLKRQSVIIHSIQEDADVCHLCEELIHAIQFIDRNGWIADPVAKWLTGG
jgi:hypothetical protein